MSLAEKWEGYKQSARLGVLEELAKAAFYAGAEAVLVAIPQDVPLSIRGQGTFMQISAEIDRFKGRNESKADKS